MLTPTEAIIRGRHEGQMVAVGGDLCTILATGEETGGAYAAFEVTIWPNGGTLPHIHRVEDEVFYVLEGEPTFRVASRTVTVKAETFIHVPKGVLHAYRNETQAMVRLLVQVTPAGLERFFLTVGQPVTKRDERPAAPTEEDIARLRAAAPRFGLELPQEGTEGSRGQGA